MDNFCIEYQCMNREYERFSETAQVIECPDEIGLPVD